MIVATSNGGAALVLVGVLAACGWLASKANPR